jgi:hypothetical protein
MASAGRYEAVSTTAGLAVALAAVLTIPECRGFDAPTVTVVSAGGTGGASGSSGGGGSSAGTAGDSGSGGTSDAANGGSSGTGVDASSGGAGGRGTSSGGMGSGGMSGTGADGGDAAVGDYLFSEVYRGSLFDLDGGLYRGWTSIMPFVWNTGTHFIFYDTNSGVARIALLKEGLQGVGQVWTEEAWFAGQSNLVPYYVGTEPFFVTYHPFLQKWNYNRFYPGLAGPELTHQGSPKPDSGLPPTFTEILLFRQDLSGRPANYLFWYSRLDSSVRLEKITDDGKQATTLYETHWDNGVTHAAGFSTPQGWFALMFKTIRNKLFFLQVDENGVEQRGGPGPSFNEPFSLMTFYESDDGYFVLLYGQDGTSALFEFKPSVLELNNVWRGTLRPGANVIAAFIDGQKPHVILSDQATGVGTFYTITRTTSDR